MPNLRFEEKIEFEFLFFLIYLQEWILLWQVNFEDLIDEHFKKASDWEAQWKYLKDKRKEAENIPRF